MKTGGARRGARGGQDLEKRHVPGPARLPILQTFALGPAGLKLDSSRGERGHGGHHGAGMLEDTEADDLSTIGSQSRPRRLVRYATARDEGREEPGTAWLW